MNELPFGTQSTEMGRTSGLAVLHLDLDQKCGHPGLGRAAGLRDAMKRLVEELRVACDVLIIR